MIESYAHGRVNLMGEHTDYNGGWVLPTLIPQKTEVQLRRRNDDLVRVRSDMAVRSSEAALGSHLISRTTLPAAPDAGSTFASLASAASSAASSSAPSRGTAIAGPEKFDYEYYLGWESKTGQWPDYVQGATQFLREKGFKLKGFDLTVLSNVPVGSGLSSSAALEVALLKALRQAFGLTFDDIEMAHLGQKIENEFIGARVGILDQMAIGLGRENHALYLDTQLMEYDLIPLPAKAFDLVVINSGVTHNHASGDYNQRRAECEAACKELEIVTLRDLGMSDLAKLDQLDEKLKRRARHVITENARVHQAVQAIKAVDFVSLGQLFYQSHESMRDDYQVSVPQIDLLIELCRAEATVYGARLTGGGFGGSIVAITHLHQGRQLAEKIVDRYAQKQSQFKATIMTPMA